MDGLRAERQMKQNTGVLPQELEQMLRERRRRYFRAAATALGIRTNNVTRHGEVLARDQVRQRAGSAGAPQPASLHGESPADLVPSSSRLDPTVVAQ